MWKVLEHNFVLLVLILRKVRTLHGCKYQYKKIFFAQGIGINKEFSSKTDTVFKVSFPHHFSAVGLCLTVWLNVVSWLWKAMEYLGIHGYWRSAYCESCCFAAEMGDSSLEHTDMHRKTNSGNIFFICFLFICHLLLLWTQKTFTPSYYYCYYFFCWNQGSHQRWVSKHQDSCFGHKEPCIILSVSSSMHVQIMQCSVQQWLFKQLIVPCKSNADNDLCSSYQESNIIRLVYYVVLIFESVDSYV